MLARHRVHEWNAACFAGPMNISRIGCTIAIFLAMAGAAQAHPGHDGHELTWEFRHLAQHPVVALGLGFMLAMGAAGIWQLLRLGRIAREDIERAAASRDSR